MNLIDIDYYESSNVLLDTIGSCIAYFTGIAFYIYVCIRLLYIFDRTILSVSLRIFISITIMSLSTIMIEIFSIYWEYFSTKIYFITGSIYSVCYFGCEIWLIYMFNKILYKAILLHHQSQLLSSSKYDTSHDNSVSLDVNDININRNQHRMINIMTKQTLLHSIALIADMIYTVLEPFFENNKNHNQTQRIIIKCWLILSRVITIIIIYISYQFRIANSIYTNICHFCHKGLFRCCQRIVKNKIKKQYKSVTLNQNE